VNLPAEGLAHLSTADICDCVKRQAIEQLVVIHKVLSYAVDYEVQEFVLLMQEQSHCQVADLFL